MLGGLIACLPVVGQTAAPIILKQPVDVTAAYGDSVTLRVEAIGPDLKYKWEKQTGKSWAHRITVGIKETLPLTDLGPENAGTYRVNVSSGGYGSVNSREFTLSFPADTGVDRESFRTRARVSHARVKRRCAALNLFSSKIPSVSVIDCFITCE